MRTLTAGATAEIAKKLGTEPLLIVEVDWAPLTKYADRDYNGIPGKILAVSGLDSIIKLGRGSSSGTVSITLDDTDGSIKERFDSQRVHKRTVNVYQAFEALPESDKFLIFSGELSTPVSYSEGERTISFEVTTQVEDCLIGFSPEQEDADFVAESAVGVPWPLCFGSPVRVPAVKVAEETRGTSLTRFGLITQSELDSLCSTAASAADAEQQKTVADTSTIPFIILENYCEIVDVLTNNTIALNNAVEVLVSESPTQEVNIRRYAVVCKDIRLNERNRDLAAAEILSLDVTIAALEKTIEDLNTQILNETDPVAKAALQDTLADTTAELVETENERAAELLLLLVANSNLSSLNAEKDSLTATLTAFNISTIEIEGGEEFPQGIPTVIVINGVKFNGTFSGTTFTIIESNIPAETGVLLGARQNSNANEFWLADAGINLKNKYVYFGDSVCYVENQDGNRCFISPVLYEVSGVHTFGTLERVILSQKLLGPLDSIAQTSMVFRPQWLTLINAQLNPLDLTNEPDCARGITNIRDRDYSIEVGDDVYLDSDFQQLYVANLLPSSSINEVMAFRTVDGVERLTPVPSQYFEATLSDTLLGQTPTTLRFRRPLDQYVGEDWGDEIFVSLTSTVGPNTVDVIEHIVDTYTDLSKDASSFSAVSASLTKYPSHFAYFERVPALQFIEDVAYQARCAAYQRGGTIFLKYLSAEEAAVQTLTETDIEVGTFEVELTDTEDLITELTAEWTPDYSEEEPRKFVYRNNIPRYGTIEETFDFFIYNIQELVAKSLFFHMIRRSNTYKIVKFRTFLNTFILEEFDTVELNFANDLIASAPVKGIVKGVIYDSNTLSFEYTVETEVKAGFLTEYPFYWPGTATGTFPHSSDDQTGGAAC